ncbi:MAG: hypothetical protein Aurels2KO_27240 [Aureliella sp.]
MVANPLVIAMLLIVGLGMVQTASLPRSLYETFSPTADFEAAVSTLAAELDPDAASAEPVRMAARTAISVHPEQTSATLAVFSLAAICLISSIVLFRTVASAIALLAVLAVVGFAESWLGLYQAVVAGDWKVLADLKASSFATFYSRNSAPQYFASALGATVALSIFYRKYITGAREDKRYQIQYPSVNPIARVRRRVEEFVSEIDPVSAVLLIVMVSILAGTLVANSRGGILACVASGIVTVGTYAMGKNTSAGGTIAVVLLIALCGGFLSLFELDDLIGTRLDTISAEAHSLSNARFELWQMALSQRCTWLLGSGLGAFHFAILPAYTVPTTVWFYHAENIYIEVLHGVGPIGLLAALVGLGWLLRRLLQQTEHSTVAQALRLAVLYCVVAIGLQSLVDFSLVLPGVFLPTIALVGAYLGCCELPKEKSRKRKKRRKSESHSRHKSRRAAPAKANSEERSSRNEVEHDRSGARRSRKVAFTSPAFLVGIAATMIFLIPILPGWSAVEGFASAELVSSGTEMSDEDGPQTPSLEAPLPEGDFSEVIVQRSRLMQDRAQDFVLRRAAWPDEITDKMRASIAKPEFYSVAYRSPGESLRELLRLLPDGVDDQLRASAAEMQVALGACPLDWRASWGLLRSDTGQLSASERSHNYARILIGCRHRRPIMEAASTNALMSGHPAGLALLRVTLPESRSLQSRCIVMLDKHLSLEDLLEVFPEDPLARITLAQRLERAKRPDDVPEVLETVALRSAFASKNRLPQWQQIVWAARAKGEVGVQIDALREASLDAPTNDKLNYDLAVLLRDEGRKAEAMTEILRALEFQPRNPLYRSLRDELQPN